MLKPLRLGINVDHVGTVRNARGGTHPDPVRAALLAMEAGADGITIHLREDRRHIIDSDLPRMKAVLKGPINLEMAATEEMRQIALGLKPHAVCLVPEKRTEVTTEGGLDVAGQVERLKPYVGSLAAAGIRVSMFIDADIAQLEASKAVGAAVVELHTGAYAHASGAAGRRSSRVSGQPRRRRWRLASNAMRAMGSITRMSARSRRCPRWWSSTSGISSWARRCSSGWRRASRRCAGGWTRRGGSSRLLLLPCGRRSATYHP